MNPGSTVSFECDTYITNNRQMSSRALSSESRELCHLNITNCIIREVCRGVEWHCNVLSRTLSSKWYKLYCRYVTNSVIEIPRTLSSRVCAAASNSTATYLKLNYLNDTLLHRHITNSIIWVPQTLWSGVCAVASISGATCLLCNGEGIVKFGTSACIKCGGAGECISRRTCVCVMMHVCMCHDARACASLSLYEFNWTPQLRVLMTCTNVWRIIFVLWSHALICHMWDDSCICVTWLIHMCDMTHVRIVISLVWYVSISQSYVWWLMHICDMTHSHVWHDSDSIICMCNGCQFACATGAICMCNGCHLCRCLCVCVSLCLSVSLVLSDWTWHICMSAMIHFYVWHAAFVCVTWCVLAIRRG